VPCRLLNCFQLLSSLSSSLSIASLSSFRSELSQISSLSVKQASLDSVASVSSKSVESEASKNRTPTSTTTTANIAATSDTGNGNSNNNVALVGGVVGGVLGAAVLGLIGLLLWRRNKSTPPTLLAGQQSFIGQQPSSQPITPASMTFSTNSHYVSGPLVTHAAQPRSHPPQLSHLALPAAISPTAGQPSTASQESASSSPGIKMWVENPSTSHHESYGVSASQPRFSPSTEGPVNPRELNPRELYNDAIRGPTFSTAAPVNVPSSASGTWNPPNYAPPYSHAPRRQDPGRF
jgi:hypothetical protein